MSIMYALIPAVLWGAMGIVNGWAGGRVANQILGGALGSLIFSIVVGVYALFEGPTWPIVFSMAGLTYVLSGIAWAAGTSFQLAAFKKMGISQASGLNTAGKIAVNALVGAAVFGEWQGAHQWTIGLLAIVSVIIGVFLISGKPSHLNKDGVRLTIISVFAYMIYFMIPKTVALLHLVHVDTGTLHNTMALSLPIAIGQTIGALIFGVFIFNGGNFKLPVLTKETAKNGLAGIMWGTGEVMIRLAVLNPAVGQAKASTLSQMGVIVSTLGAILILKERKTKAQIIGIAIGALFVMVGGILVTLAG